MTHREAAPPVILTPSPQAAASPLSVQSQSYNLQQNMLVILDACRGAETKSLSVISTVHVGSHEEPNTPRYTRGGAQHNFNKCHCVAAEVDDAVCSSLAALYIPR